MNVLWLARARAKRKRKSKGGGSGTDKKGDLGRPPSMQPPENGGLGSPNGLNPFPLVIIIILCICQYHGCPLDDTANLVEIMFILIEVCFRW